MRIKYFLGFFIIFTATIAQAQWTCRSKLPAHLKPIHKKIPIYWALEGTFGHGYMNDREITNALFFGGLEIPIKKHRFYFEGGRKAWRNTLGGPNKYKKSNNGFFQQSKGGIREGYYNFRDKNTTLTAGFHSMEMGDYFLVNERGLGVSYQQKISQYKIKITGASVIKDFSRFGTFCSVHYLYNVIRNRYYPVLGENIGETNFAGVVFSWLPGEKKEKEKSTEGNSDEFSNFDEFEEFSEPKKEQVLKEAGLVFYNEFSTSIDTMPIFYGAMAQWSAPADIEIETELLHQVKEDNMLLLAHIQATKNITWGKAGQTLFLLAGFHDFDIDNGAQPYASFSNLFIGEVMRLDVMDMPLYQAALRHRVPNWKSHIKLQAVGQLNGKNITEQNVALGKTFFGKIKFTAMFSRMNADVLEDIFYMARGEIRITI